MADKIAKKQNEALAVMDFEADAGAGVEGADKDSYAIPFLAVLQSNSPQVVDETVKDAKPGQILNTVTNDLYKEVEIIPVAFSRRFLLWEPRTSGGGFKGQLLASEVEEQRATGAIADKEITGEDGKPKKVLMNREGHVVRDTRQHYVLVKNRDGVWDQAMISMASTQIKRSKRWMTIIGQFMLKRKDGTPFNPPSFARIFNAKTEKEENAKGKWFSWVISALAVLDDEAVYGMAKRFNKMITEGTVKVDYSTLKEEEENDKSGF